MWKNKHVVIALLVAPVLALIAYFAVDHAVSERPHVAQSGADYPLRAKSNCRYESGLCELENGDVKLTLRVQEQAGQPLQLHLAAQLPLRGVRVAVVEPPAADATPEDMQSDGGQARSWRLDLPATVSPSTQLRFVVLVDESRYFAEVPAVFFTRPDSPTR